MRSEMGTMVILTNGGGTRWFRTTSFGLAAKWTVCQPGQIERFVPMTEWDYISGGKR